MEEEGEFERILVCHQETLDIEQEQPVLLRLLTCPGHSDIVPCFSYAGK